MEEVATVSSPKPESAPPKSPGWIESGFLLAAVPVVSYFLAFMYEFGYCRAFGIPTELISIDLTRLFLALAPWCLLLLLLLNWLDTYIESARRDAEPNMMHAFTGGMIFSVLLTAFFAAWFLPEWYVALALFLGFMLYWMLMLNPKRGFMPYILPRFGSTGLLIASMVLFGGTMSLVGGGADARLKKTFFVLHEQEEVVLRIYGSMAICAPYNESPPRIEGRRILRWLASDQPVALAQHKFSKTPVRESIEGNGVAEGGK